MAPRLRDRRAIGMRTLAMSSLAAASLVAAVPGGAAAPNARITDAKDGFSLVLPAGWTKVSLSKSDIGSIGRTAQNYAGLKSLLTQQATSAAAKGLKFFAVAPGQVNGQFVPNINVGLFTSSGSLKALQSDIKTIWNHAGAKGLQTKQVHLAFGKAVEGTYELISTTTSPSIWETQVYAPHKGHVYITTFSATTKPAVELTAAVVMATWKFTR
jgi:hypothetical protein